MCLQDECNIEIFFPMEYYPEVPQSHTADQPMASRGRATEH